MASVLKTYIASLHKVAADEEVLLIRRNLDVVRSNDGLLLIRVVETLDVVEVRNIKRSDVVAQGNGKVSKFTVVRDVRVNGDRLLGIGAEVVQELRDTLLAVGVLAEGVDDPDLAVLDGRGERRALLVARDELDVLDALAVGDSDGGDDLAGVERPQAERVGLLDAERRDGLEDGHGDDKVRGQHDVVLKVDAQAVGAELLAEDVERALDILGPLVDDVTAGVSLDQAAGGAAHRAAHVGDEKAAFRLGADLIGDGAQQSAIAVRELWVVRVARVPVVCSVLGLEQGKETATDKCLAVKRGTKMVRGVSARGHIRNCDKLSKGVL